ncbi:dehydrogenase/reductase SDR family member 4-like [Phlebotomus papatasi]|uniref:dehydrogenase/reductase SDR family member 4-like n=1 Tax=Phlebotomus papatasi TaxID=29031 RepID=UPI0024836968|nr:dehydrogenase/reductase SDR family member 4-like [Phlebotomus papatasi]
MYHCSRFAGKVAVLSASSEGMGLAIARRLGQEKAKVVVSSRNMDNVNKAVETLKKENIEVVGVKCHISNPEERTNLIQDAVKHFGGIDILMINAGVNPHVGNLVDCPESAWDKAFDVNVKGPFLLAKEIIPLMKKRGGGSMLFMSTVSVYKDAVGLGLYASSKTCLLRLTKHLAMELAQDNIRVNCVAPGPIDTTFISEYSKTEFFKRSIVNDVPMQRVGRTEEVAGTAAFLLSDDASYITGETIPIAGGLQTRL